MSKIVLDQIKSGITMILSIMAMSALFALPVMWIWNYLMTPELTEVIFGMEKLNFLKALWLSWLCSILFKGSNR